MATQLGRHTCLYKSGTAIIDYAFSISAAINFSR
jgi:hypothetical protein